eukprot:7118474-Alexandrium_andersonii.AAC.1
MPPHMLASRFFLMGRCNWGRPTSGGLQALEGTARPLWRSLDRNLVELGIGVRSDFGHGVVQRRRCSNPRKLDPLPIRVDAGPRRSFSSS